MVTIKLVGNAWSSYYVPGWSDQNDKFTLQTITTGVDSVSIASRGIVIKKDNKYYGWETSVRTGWGSFFDSAKELSFGSSGLSASQVNSIFYFNYQGEGSCCMIGTDGKLYYRSTYSDTGKGRITNAYTGCPVTPSNGWNFNDRSTGVIGSNEKVINVVVGNEENYCLYLTDKGNLYGWGNGRYLGKSGTAGTMYNIPSKLLDNVSQVCSGDGFIVVVKKDGSVWGIGDNKYGQLGRWRTSTKTSANSRYKNAYEWVECPDLEL